MAERKHGVRAPETDATIAGEDWTERDISGEQHTRIAFVDLDLSEIEERGALFTECTFRRTRFNCSAHIDAAFVNCTFINCNFFETRFAECKLVGSMFDRCTFDLLRVEGGNWSHVGLPGADLRRASIRGARMHEADLTGAKCEGASIRDADLTGAWLRAATLARCDLRGSDLGGLDLEGVDLAGATVTAEQAVVIAMAMGIDVRVE